MTRTLHRIFVGKDAHKFSSAHMTIFPDGSKEPLHGHNFQVTVAFDMSDVSMASFLDFAVVERAVAEQCKAWHDCLLLPELSPHYRLISNRDNSFEFTLCNKRYVVPTDEVVMVKLENIVVETLAIAFAQGMVARMGGSISPKTVLGIEVSVSEAPGLSGGYYWTWPS